jgi:ankyrin repeat protein
MDVNFTDATGETPVGWAALYRRPEIVEVLLEVEGVDRSKLTKRHLVALGWESIP